MQYDSVSQIVVGVLLSVSVLGESKYIYVNQGISSFDRTLSHMSGPGLPYESICYTKSVMRLS